MKQLTISANSNIETELIPYVIYTPREQTKTAFPKKPKKSNFSIRAFPAQSPLPSQRLLLHSKTQKKLSPGSGKFQFNTISKEYSEIQMLQQTLNKDFSLTRSNLSSDFLRIYNMGKIKGTASEKTALPQLFKESTAHAKEILGFITAAILGKVEHMSQYLSTLCGTVLEKKLLINSGDQFGRNALFYAIFKGKF